MSELREHIRRLGHRNWIAVVDMAFPMLCRSGLQTLGGYGLAEVVAAVRAEPHVRIEAIVDAELAALSDQLCEGSEKVRTEIYLLLEGLPVSQVPHEEIIRMLNKALEDGFEVLIVKTETLVPYTSVFCRLECGYWTPAQEQALRAEMAGK